MNDTITFEKPTVLDIADMQELVESYVKEGIILYRSDNEVATTIRSYTVVKDAGKLIGFSALHIHSTTLCEIRSLLVAKEYRGQKIASKLVERLLEEAKQLNLKEVLALTYVEKFFESLDFKQVPKEAIPEHKIWLDCSRCKHFPVCNEISLVKHI
jgi:amino-acid N-acetyltransferase